MSAVYTQLVRCRDCGRKYRFHAGDLDDAMPDCPACGAVDEPPEIPVSQQVPTAPALRSVQTKANDMAMRIVAEDYGMTDLRVDNLQPGDISAPKLTPDQQDMAAAWQGTGGSGRAEPLPIPDSATLLNMARNANALAPAVPMIGKVQRAIKKNEEGARHGRGHLMRDGKKI
jgi:hypothetical protein